jgi:methionyl aminopeptidase
MSKLIKTPEEIVRIRQSGKILAGILRRLKAEAKPGIRLIELEQLTKTLLDLAGGTPTFLGYRSEGAREPYPFALCTSVNEAVVHGRPSSYTLRSGDILKLDLGVSWQGGFTDAAVTVPIGKVSGEANRLIQTTKNALVEAIRAVKPGNTVGDIGFAVQHVVQASGVKVLDGLTGHGVGLEVHEDPIIYNFGERGKGVHLEEGMVLAIEPMTALTTSKAVQVADDSFITADGSISAHFEHTVLVTKKGAEILTD